MLHFTIKRAAVIAIGALVTLATQTPAQTSNSATTDTHKHEHHAHKPSLINGAEVQARDLSDWENDWQSIYPFLQDGIPIDPFEGFPFDLSH